MRCMECKRRFTYPMCVMYTCKHIIIYVNGMQAQIHLLFKCIYINIYIYIYIMCACVCVCMCVCVWGCVFVYLFGSNFVSA